MKFSIRKSTVLDFVWFLFFVINFAHQGLFQGIQLLSVCMLLLATLFCNNWKVSLCRNGRVAIWYILFAVYVFASTVWSIGINDNSNVLDIVWRNCIVVVCLCAYINSIEKYEKILKIFTWATLYFTIVFLATSPLSTWGTTQMGGVTGQFRNYAGYMMCFGALAALFLIKKEKNKRIYSLIAILCMVGAVITGSRKVYLQIALAVIMYVFSEQSLKRRTRNIALLVSGVVLSFAVLFNISSFQKFFNEKILTMFVTENTRFVSQYAADAAASTEARKLLMNMALEMFRKRPLIGCGVDSVRYYVGAYASNAINTTFSHNNYAEVLACFGLIGLVMYYLCILHCEFKTLKIVVHRLAYKNEAVWRYLYIFFTLYLILDYATVSYYYLLSIALLVINMCGCVQSMRKDYIDG